MDHPLHPLQPIDNAPPCPLDSALAEVRSKQVPPLLRFDTDRLSDWQVGCIDSDDLAGLWNALTKCKTMLSDGYRLENITWRLWQREKFLSSSARQNHPNSPSFSSSSSASLSVCSPDQNHHHCLPVNSSITVSCPLTSPTPRPYSLSQCSSDLGSMTPTPTSNNVLSRLASPSLLQSNGLSLQSPASGLAAKQVLSFEPGPVVKGALPSETNPSLSPSALHHSPPFDRTNGPIPPSLSLLPSRISPPVILSLLPPPSTSPHTSHPEDSDALTTDHPITCSVSTIHPHTSIFAPPYYQKSEPSVSKRYPKSPPPNSICHLLPPARPNAITPSNLGTIIDTILPMEIALEQIKSRPSEQNLASCSESPTYRKKRTQSYLASDPARSSVEVSLDINSPEMSNFRLDTMEASKKAQSTSFSGLQAPPRIVNIAPTPPPASPAVTAPPSPAVHHSPLCHNPHPQLLSPVPSLLTSEAFTKPNLSSPNSDSSSYHQHEGVHVQRPAIGQRYSSDSASASSIGCRSVATSPSIQGQDETAGRVTPLASTDKRLQASVRTTSRCNVSHRRATSTIGFKNKRKPYAFSRTLSGSSTRSASPKAGGSSKIVGCVGSRGKGVQGDHAIADVSSNKPSDLEPFLEPNSSDASVATGTALSMHGGSTVPVSKAKVARASFAFVNQSHRSGSSVDGSLASANSLVVPVTPNNSQVSPSLQLRQGTTSTASSQITQCSSAFLPSAPPPTPAQNGVPLPTTMSARIGKSRAVEKKAEISFLKEVSTTEAIALKKKAKFYINGYETEEDAVLSSLSVPSQVGAHIPPGEVRGNLSNQQLTSEVQSSEMLRNPSHGSKAAPTKTNDGDDEEDSDGSDSDEWGSEYSDDDCDEEEEIAERLRLEELERKRQQEEYHRHLFAKKHFIQRNTSAIQDGESGLPPPIKRAGLSMLFHPELNHLKHHPQQKAVAESTAGATVAGGPNRNQSAIELRQGPRRPMNITRQSNEGDTSRRSFHAIPRPSSLIKSKSSIAVPVLAGHRPPEMVERSPSINSGGSSLPHHVAERAGIGGSGSGKSGGTNPITDVGINKHQRHPSRLKGKPENIEYSDDDESEEEQVGREEQERKLDQLALVANRGARAIAARPEPIAPPLSPRTTRRNMLANEMTESVRRNLLWERQIRTQSWGIVVGVASKDGKDAARGGNVALQGMKDGATTGVGDGKLFATTDVDRIKQQQQKYRTSSKGFHRTGW